MSRIPFFSCLKSARNRIDRLLSDYPGCQHHVRHQLEPAACFPVKVDEPAHDATLFCFLLSIPVCSDPTHHLQVGGFEHLSPRVGLLVSIFPIDVCIVYYQLHSHTAYFCKYQGWFV